MIPIEIFAGNIFYGYLDAIVKECKWPVNETIVYLDGNDGKLLEDIIDEDVSVKALMRAVEVYRYHDFGNEVDNAILN